jgi:hypothetical protein
LTKDLINIKKEPKTPVRQISACSSCFFYSYFLFQPKTKRRQSKTSSNSKQKNLSLIQPLRQMTMTQIFHPIESPKSNTDLTPIKQEPSTPSDDTIMFMPESLIGLAQPSELTFDSENEQVKYIINI